jgi:hypothetical protein
MVQMTTAARKPIGRPKQKRPTSKLQNTTIRDFGGGLNVVDSEQSLTSKFSPVFDNMITYTDRRVGPRQGFEMWLKLKQDMTHGGVTSGAANITISTIGENRIVTVNWTGHPIAAGGTSHITISNWDQTYSGIAPEIMNRTHGVRRVLNANQFEIVIPNSPTITGTSPVEAINWTHDTFMLGGEPVECKYFANYIIVWSNTGEIIRIDRDKNMQRIFSHAIAFAQNATRIGWTYTDIVANDIFGQELVCSNGHDKPLSIDFTRVDWVIPLTDPGNSSSNIEIPAFDACKSAFRYFTVHDTDLRDLPDYNTSIRIAAKDTCVVFSTAPSPMDAVDINMSKIVASPEQAVRGFATIKDALLVITPTATTLMKLGVMSDTSGSAVSLHDPVPVDTLNGFGSNAPRSIVEIGSDVFMVDFNGVPSAKLSTVSNAVVPERVSNYIESMISSHIARLKKETMRLKVFSFYDSKNKTVHFYLPNFDVADMRRLTSDPLYFDSDMGLHEDTKRTLIARMDNHKLEEGDLLDVSGATAIGAVDAININGRRQVVSVLNENYVLMSIGEDLPTTAAASNIAGGGNNVQIRPVYNGSIGYIYHYVPQLKIFAWSRFKTARPDAINPLMFNCGCGTIEGRSFLFTPDGHMMLYGTIDHKVHGDWVGMYDFVEWISGQAYVVGQRVFDDVDGLVYKCIENVTTTAADFATARALVPDAWEEYKGEAIVSRWELPWADFGARQSTKALRFVHIDASGDAQFKLRVYSDNIYKDTATGKKMPARELQFVPNEAGAYGSGQQVYGAGRRTREQKMWQVPVRFKLLKASVEAETTGPLSINAISFMYQRGSMVRG